MTRRRGVLAMWAGVAVLLVGAFVHDTAPVVMRCGVAIIWGASAARVVHAHNERERDQG